MKTTKLSLILTSKLEHVYPNHFKMQIQSFARMLEQGATR